MHLDEQLMVYQYVDGYHHQMDARQAEDEKILMSCKFVKYESWKIEVFRKSLFLIITIWSSDEDIIIRFQKIKY